MAKTSYNAAYGHGHRTGVFYQDMRVSNQPPEWMPTRWHRFCWRQGFKNGAGEHTMLSTLTLMFIGE